MATLLTTVSDPASLLSYTRRLLHTPHESTPAPTELEPTHPLAVLLLLLDSISYLRSVGAGEKKSDGEKRVTKKRNMVSPSSSPRKNSSVGLGIEGDDEGDEADVEELTTKVRRFSSSTNGGRRRSIQVDSDHASYTSDKAEEGDDNDSWDDWSTYMKEMYLFPFEKPSPYEYANGSIWISPLYVSLTIVPSLPRFCALDTYSQKVHEEISACCQSSIDCLSSLDFPNSPSPTLESFLSLPSTTFPKLLPPSLHSTISSTLASRRRASLSSAQQNTPTILTFRWILTTILAHFVGPAFGQLQSESSSKAGGTYAKDEEDDEGIRGYYKFMGVLEEDSATEELDAQDGVRVALASILRRDDKMRWIFGDNFQAPRSRPTSQHPSPAISSPSRSPPIPAETVIITQQEDVENLVDSTSTSPPLRKGRPLSVSSQDSRSSTDRPIVSATSNSHRRVYSTSSSITPLLEAAEPGQVTPSSKPIVKGHSRAQSRVVDPAPHPPSPTFGNLAPAGSRSNSPKAPIYISTTNHSSPTLPLTTNTLSPEERRDLVWRSQKLNKMFGVPLEEGAVQEVLVRNNVFDRVYDSSPEGSPDLYKMRPKTTSNAERRPSFASSHRSNSSRRNSLPPPVSPISGSSSPSGPQGGLGPGSYSMGRSLSSPASRSKQDSTTDEDLHNVSRKPAVTAEQQRDERRKKMAKLSRLLGEKVPAHLVLNEKKPASIIMGRSGSGSRLGGMLGKFVGRGGRREEQLPSSKDEFAQRDESIIQVDLSAAGAHKTVSPLGGETGKAVGGMAKARKLEQLFGDLPPRNLYATRMSPHQRSFSDMGSVTSTGATPAMPYNPHNRESTSTTRSIDSYRHSIASLSYLAEKNPSALDDIAKVYDEEHRDRVLSHRASIASQAPARPRLPTTSEPAAQPVSDADPVKSEDPVESAPQDSTSSEVLSDADGEGDGPLVITDSDAELRKMRASTFSNLSSTSSAYRPQSMQQHTSTEGQTSPEEDRRPVSGSRRTDSVDSTINGRRRSVSAGDHKQTVKRAQKLAGFFGTTRGEVWKMLLEDLEASILEEDELDEVERKEVLDGVTRLRDAVVS